MQVDLPAGFAPTLRELFEQQADHYAEMVSAGEGESEWMVPDAERFRTMAQQLAQDGSVLDVEPDTGTDDGRGYSSVTALLQDKLRDLAAEDEWGLVISCATVLRDLEDANADLPRDTQEPKEA